MIEPLLELAPHIRRRLIDALESGLLAPPFSESSIRSALGGFDGQNTVLEALEKCTLAGVSGPVAARWIASLEKQSPGVLPASLAWTGPAVRGLHSRDTKQVFEELILAARTSLLISSYVYFDGPEAFKTLAQQMDRHPSLEVTLLLNVQRERFSTTKTESLLRRFAERLWNREWPGTRRPAVYYDPRSLNPDGPDGVLHAKAVICDNESLLVTSANLTEAAMRRNVEMGILIRDGPIARTASAHFRGLIDAEHLLRLRDSY